MTDATYYIRTEQGMPIIAVCLINDGNGGIGRGISILNPTEPTATKKRGRQIAMGRAKKALLTHKNEEPIRQGLMDELLEVGYVKDYDTYLLLSGPLYKKSYNDRITEWEQRLVTKKINQSESEVA